MRSKYLNIINEDITPLNMFCPLTLEINLHTARKVRFELTISGHTREAWCAAVGATKSQTQLSD